MSYSCVLETESCWIATQPVGFLFVSFTVSFTCAKNLVSSLPLSSRFSNAAVIKSRVSLFSKLQFPGPFLWEALFYFLVNHGRLSDYWRELRHKLLEIRVLDPWQCCKGCFLLSSLCLFVIAKNKPNLESLHLCFGKNLTCDLITWPGNFWYLGELRVKHKQINWNLIPWNLRARRHLTVSAAAAAKSLQSCPTLCDPIDGKPTRLPRPWDSPGKNTGGGCHFLLQCMKVKSESEVAQSCPTLSDPMDCSPPGSSIHGIFHSSPQKRHFVFNISTDPHELFIPECRVVH